MKEPDDRIPLLDALAARTAKLGVLETHPAVAMAVMWPEGKPLPRYKKGKGTKSKEIRAAIKEIQDFFGDRSKEVFGETWTRLPENVPAGVEQDDLLDAQMSFLTVAACRIGLAMVLGDTSRGGFVVPRTRLSVELQREYCRIMRKISGLSLAPL